MNDCTVLLISIEPFFLHIGVKSMEGPETLERGAYNALAETIQNVERRRVMVVKGPDLHCGRT
jgi:hypothetical protein